MAGSKDLGNPALKEKSDLGLDLSIRKHRIAIVVCLNIFFYI